MQTETLVKKVAEADFPNPFSRDFKVKVFRNHLDGSENIVIQKGTVRPGESTLVRVQVENVLGDVFHGGALDSGGRILGTLAHLAKADSGIFVYLRKEGKNSLISQHVNLLDDDEFLRKMDSKEYGIGAQILRALGVQKIKLLANAKPRTSGIKGFGLEIEEVVPYRPVLWDAKESLSPKPVDATH